MIDFQPLIGKNTANVDMMQVKKLGKKEKKWDEEKKLPRTNTAGVQRRVKETNDALGRNANRIENLFLQENRRRKALNSLQYDPPISTKCAWKHESFGARNDKKFEKKVQNCNAQVIVSGNIDQKFSSRKPGWWNVKKNLRDIFVMLETKLNFCIV